MKQLLLSMMAFVTFASSNACADSNAGQDPALAKEFSENVQNFGTTVPVTMEKENGKYRVNFIITAQNFEIQDIKENAASISMIREAVKNETPVHVFLRANTHEIVKVDQPTEDEIRYFKSLLTKDARTETRKAISVIPNQATLNSLFTQIKNQSCGTSTASSPCITFRYAVDGCYARAHKMRQILLNAGYDCEKQFVYGNLKASTGTCCVSWGYHVAVLVSFKNASGTVEKRIIDPSLFTGGPVTDTAWRNACVNTSCGSASASSYANTTGDVYYRSPSGSLLYDDNYVNTNCVLTTFATLSGCSPSPAPSVASCGF